MNLSRELHIDFETFSCADLVKVGAWRYSIDPTTVVLMMAWAFDDDEPVVWVPGELFPEWVYRLGDTNPGFIIHAYNDFFEYCIVKNTLRWTCPPSKFWYDIAADAAAHSLPRSLGECCEVLNLPAESLKDPRGKALIDFFSKPANVKESDPNKMNLFGDEDRLPRRLPTDYPIEFNEFKEYCKQDVVAQRAVKRMLPTLSARERKLWRLDRDINARGIPVDIDNVKNAIAIAEQAKEKIVREVHAVTRGSLVNVGSAKQLMAYVETSGWLTLDNTQKEYLKAIVEAIPEGKANSIKRVIELRLSYSKASTAKYEKLLDIVDPKTRRAYGLLRFHGASTGRWSGNLFQPQNLPRPSFDDTDKCAELFHHRDADLIEFFYGDVMEALSSTIRAMIAAPEGKRLVVSDLSQIESRALAWLAGDDNKLDAYRRGLDIYLVNAAAAYGKTYETIDRSKRKDGKVIELACGYQGGVGAFMRFAKTVGLVIEEELAEELVKKWRLNNPKVVSYWSNVEQAAAEAVANPGKVVNIRNVKFKVEGPAEVYEHKGKKYHCVGRFLYCKLPSGRKIAYHRPHLIDGKFGKVQVGFFGVDSETKKYVHQTTYGGKLVENITQAVSRDFIAEALPKLARRGYKTILHVHDEIINEMPEGEGSLDELNQIMTDVPTWAEGLPIAAAGYESKRYKKD